MNACQIEMLQKPKRKIKPIRQLQANEPYMKLTVIRSHDPFHIPINYLLTSRGMINSKKNTATKDLIIGRQQNTHDVHFHVSPKGRDPERYRPPLDGPGNIPNSLQNCLQRRIQSETEVAEEFPDFSDAEAC